MPRPVAFISYSSRDRGVAASLASALRDLGVLDVWFDQDEVGLGDSVPGRIAEGLSRADFIVLLVSASYLESRWCRAEYEPLLAREIESGRTCVVAVRLDDSELPVLLRAKHYADLRGGAGAEDVRKLARDIGETVSNVRFAGLVPPPGTAEKLGYEHSVLSLIIASALGEYPVPELGREGVLAGKSLVDLYRAVEALIGRFQDLCDEIVGTLTEGGLRPGVHQSVYGTGRVGAARVRSANRRLAAIALDMREIASHLREILPDGSPVLRRFAALLQLCASISVVENFLAVELGAPPGVVRRREEDREHRQFFPTTDELDGLRLQDGWDNSEKLDEYARVLALLDAYKAELRREVARLASQPS